MLGTVARYGHNVLLIALAIVTVTLLLQFL